MVTNYWASMVGQRNIFSQVPHPGPHWDNCSVPRQEKDVKVCLCWTLNLVSDQKISYFPDFQSKQYNRVIWIREEQV
jgi:hypothetical protein